MHARIGVSDKTYLTLFSFHVSEQALAADTLIFQYIVKNGKISMQLFYFVLEM